VGYLARFFRQGRDNPIRCSIELASPIIVSRTSNKIPLSLLGTIFKKALLLTDLIWAFTFKEMKSTYLPHKKTCDRRPPDLDYL